MTADDHVPVRRVPVPQRTVGDQIVIARPVDGTPIVLGATAATVWSALAIWRRPPELDRLLAERWPEVHDRTRQRALEDILALLDSEGVLERTAP
jgi:hypothetical protein